MQNEYNALAELNAIISKSFTYILSILMGLIGSIGFDLMVNKRYTWKQRVGIVMVSLTFGTLGSLVCEHHDFGFLKHVVPALSTMFGQYIALYIHKNNKHLIESLIFFITKKK